MPQIEFSQYTEYVTEGPVVHPVALDQHDLGNPLALAALAEGYAHVTALGRAPVMDVTASDRLKIAASEVYHTDVVEHEVVSDRPAEVVERLLWVRDRPEWGAGMDAYLGMVVFWQGTLWRCLQSHRTQAQWRPGAAGTAALWARYYALDEAHAWVQPLGSEDAYARGAKVTHDGHTWTSLIDANVWAPGTGALWRCEDCEPVGPGEWAAGVAYKVGDRVTYQGAEYRCLQSHTSLVGWEPPVVPALWLKL